MIYKVYRNLNNGLISIAERSSGLVVAHCDSVTLRRVSFRVSAKGRQRVIDEGRKNVHAFVIGRVIDAANVRPYKGRNLDTGLSIIEDDDMPVSVTYNPFKVAQFVQRKTGVPVFTAQYAKIDKSGNIQIMPVSFH